MNRRGVPSGYSVGGSSGVDFGREEEANRILNTLKNKYNYDPGGLDQFTRAIDNNKFFVRGDVNFSPNHRFTVRHNYIDATNDIGRLSLTEFFFPGLLLSLQEQDELNGRAVEQHVRPHVQRAARQLPARARRPRRRYGVPRAVRSSSRPGSGNGLFRVGRERSSTANELDQDIIEITDDFTLQLARIP